MSQAPRWLPMGRAPSRPRALRTHAAARALSTSECSLAPDPLPLSTLGPPPSAWKTFRLYYDHYYDFNALQEKKEGCGLFCFLATRHSHPPERLLCAGPFAWRWSAVERLGGAQGGPRPISDSLELGRIGGPFGGRRPPKAPQKGEVNGAQLHVAMWFLDYSPCRPPVNSFVCASPGILEWREVWVQFRALSLTCGMALRKRLPFSEPQVLYPVKWG